MMIAAMDQPSGAPKHQEFGFSSRLMRRYSKKLVSRCTYCNILLATETDVLEEFLTKDGWDIVNSWLKDAKKEGNAALMSELLKLLDHCPMTVDRLKQNDTAKVIKLLSKWESVEVAENAKKLVTKWMKLIKAGNELAKMPEENKKKRKKESEKVIANHHESSDIPNRVKKVKKISHPRESDSELFEVNDSLVTLKTDSVNCNSNSENSIPKQRLEVIKSSDDLSNDGEMKFESRPKTAKIRLGKSRSIGVLEDTTSPTTVKPKTDLKNKSVPVIKDKVVGTPTTATPVGLLNKTSTITPISSSKAKASEADSRVGGIKLIEPKPLTNLTVNNANSVNKASHTIKESASFMDAIITNTDTKSQTKKAKRRNLAKSRDDEVAERSDSADGKADEDESESADGENQAEENEDEPPEMTEIEKQIEAELHREEYMLTESVDDVSDYGLRDGDEERPLEPLPPPPSTKDPIKSPVQTKSILCYGRKLTQKKKSVRWLPDERIKEVKFFELDETERINVSRPLLDYRAMEAKGEKQAILSARRGAPVPLPERAPIEHLPWRVVLIDLPEGFPLIEAGKQSREKAIQAERHSCILPEFYPSREFAPDCPQEPDAFEGFAGAHEAPRVIPLDDENNPNIYDFSHLELPKPKTGETLPPRVGGPLPPVSYQTMAPAAPPTMQPAMPPNSGYPPFGSIPQQPPLLQPSAQMLQSPMTPGPYSDAFGNPMGPRRPPLPPQSFPPPGPPSGPYPSYATPPPPPPPPMSGPPPKRFNRPPTPFGNERRNGGPGRGGSRPVCRNFQRSGFCKYQNCSYLHANPGKRGGDRNEGRDKRSGKERKMDGGNSNGNLSNSGGGGSNSLDDGWGTSSSDLQSASMSLNSMDSRNSSQQATTMAASTTGATDIVWD